MRAFIIFLHVLIMDSLELLLFVMQLLVHFHNDSFQVKMRLFIRISLLSCCNNAFNIGAP